MAFRIVGLLAAAALLVVTALPELGRAQQPSPQQPQPQSQQPQEKRIALVIGNGSYVKAPLATAANDAGLVAQTLQAAGFEVIGARDLDGDTLRGSFRDFIQKAEASGPDTVAMVYLSGYGLQLAGENYFIPVDSKIERDTDIPTEGLRLNDYMRQLAALPLKAGVVVLDIARQQPFIDGNAQIASGLALVDPEPKMLIAFNAAPGTVAPEEQGGGLGRRLMRRLIDLARWHRAERVFLEVRPSNPRAIALYDQLGFNEIGRRPNYYPAKRGREDAIVMAMELLGGEE